MKNKIGKLFVFAILGFLASTISVHAATYDITDPDSFGAMMDEYNSTTQSIYVIGSYVFTTKHTLTTQDMMLAALSIDLKDVEGDKVAPSESYNKMTIFKLEREYDDDDEPTGKWKVLGNYVGSDSLKDNKVEVTYVDYQKVGEEVEEEYSLEVNTEPTEDMRSALEEFEYGVILENQEEIEATPNPLDPTKITLTGKVHYIPKLANWGEAEQTGYYVALELKLPEDLVDTAQWWFSTEPDEKLVHDNQNYAIKALNKNVETAEQTFDICVDFDGDGEADKTYTFDYSNLEFTGQQSSATVSEKTENQEVLNVYSTALNIKKEDFLTITADNKITGTIRYNPDVTVDAVDKTNYYIPVVVTIDKAYVDKATFTTVNGDRTKNGTFKDNADSTDKTTLAILFAVKEENDPKTFTITIDLDGDETNFEPKVYEFDYSEAIFTPEPTASVSENGTEDNQEKYAEIMNEQFGFEGNQDTLNVAVDEDKVTLTGKLVNKSYSFNGKDTTVDGYYFQYVIEISGDATYSSITIPADGKTKTFTYEQYDFRNENGKSGIVVLHKLNKEKEEKKFEVTVDLDGDGNADKTYTFDYSAVEFDKNSEVKVSSEASKVSTTDKEELVEWGFPETALSLTTIENNVIKGTIPYVEHISEDAFSGEDVTGNYMVYTIEIPNENRDKAQIKLHCTTGANCQNGWKIIDAEKDSDTSILHSVTIKEDNSIDDIVAYVDLDGFANNDVAPVALEPEPIYLPYEIRLTFDKDIIVQQKADGHDSVPEEMAQEAKSGLTTSFNYNDVEGQELKLDYKDNTITVTGTVAKNTAVTGFGDKSSGYYIPFSLKFDEVYPDITIQMPLNKEKATYKNFDTDKEIGAILQIFPEGETSAEIIVDLDGEKTVYEPYKITVDWTGVKFLSNVVSVKEVTNESNPGLKNWMASHKSISNFSFDNYTVTQEDNKITITGKANAQAKQDGTLEWWLAYKFVFDQKYDSIELKRADGTKATDWDGGTDGKEMTFVTKLEEGKETTTTFTVDLDGNGDKYAPVTYTVDWSGVTLLSNGVQFVALTDTKKSGFENWMRGKDFENFQLGDFTVSQTDTNVTITGQAKKNTTKTQSTSEQYWIAYLLKLDKKYDKIEITKPNNSVIKIDTPNTWDTDGDNKLITFTTNVTDSISTDTKTPFTFKVDYDGANGNLYEPVTYTINWSGVTTEG